MCTNPSTFPFQTFFSEYTGFITAYQGKAFLAKVASNISEKNREYTRSKRSFYGRREKNSTVEIGEKRCKFTIAFTTLLHQCRCWLCVGCGWWLRWPSRSCMVDGTIRPCAAPGCTTSRTASFVSWPSSTSSTPAPASSLRLYLLQDTKLERRKKQPGWGFVVLYHPQTKLRESNVFTGICLPIFHSVCRGR